MSSVRYLSWIAHHSRRTPDKIAMVDLASGRRFTYAEFDARLARLAGHLRNQLTISRGDRVAVLAQNTTDTLEIQFACGRLGAVFLPLNTRLTVPELRYILDDAAPRVLLFDGDLAETAFALAGLCKVEATLEVRRRRLATAAIQKLKPLTSVEEVGLDDLSASCTRRAPPANPRAR